MPESCILGSGIWDKKIGCSSFGGYEKYLKFHEKEILFSKKDSKGVHDLGSVTSNSKYTWQILNKLKLPIVM